MWLGDLYSTFTIGTGSEDYRTAVLLNRPGRDVSHPLGSSLSSLNVRFSEAASDNIWDATSPTGTYRSDGRLGVNPYGAPVNFNNGDRNATLAALNGDALASNNFTLLMADTSSGGIATLSSWGVSLQGTAASSGTMTADASNGGTMSIADDGGTNTLGASVVTTQSRGGALSVTATGTLTFSGTVSGTGGINKLGSGTLALTGNNSYNGGTTVNAGTLLANNTSGSATGSGAVVVNNSGTVLGGTGTIGGSVTISSGAILRGGTGTSASGTLTIVGNVTLTSNSIIQLALGTPGAHSTLASTGGTWTFQSNQLFDFINLGAEIGTYDNIITGLSGPVTTTGWQIENMDWEGSFTYDGSGNIDLTLEAVPEPGTWFGGVLAVVAFLFTQRKRLLRSRRLLKHDANF